MADAIEALGKAYEAKIERLQCERNGYKADLDRVAAAVYPQKQDRFTYSVDFMIEEIQKSKRENAELRCEISGPTNQYLFKRFYRMVMDNGEPTTVDKVEQAIDKWQSKLAAAEAAQHRNEELIGLMRNGNDYELSVTIANRRAAIDAAKTEVKACPDCERAKKLAWSEFTTPGFFYTECDKHRAVRGDKP